MDNGPIFIGGLSFSGKTQLRLMLLEHPNIIITRRTRMWTRFYGRYGDLRRERNFERCLGAMTRYQPVRALNPDPQRIRQAFWQGAPTYERLFALIHQHHAEQIGKRRWGDQLGFVEQYADLILAAYPTAKMIHMLRDPRERYEEAAATSRRHRFRLGWETAAWRRSAQLADRNQQRYPERYKVVYNERLIIHPEETAAEVYDFLGEQPPPKSVALNADASPGAGNALLAKKEVSRPTGGGNNGKLLTISRRNIAFIQRYAKREMVAFDYRPLAVRLTAASWPAFLLLDWPLGLAGAVMWQAWGSKRF